MDRCRQCAPTTAIPWGGSSSSRFDLHATFAGLETKRLTSCAGAGAPWQDAADFYMIWIYTGVMLLRIIARGLVLNPDA